MNRNKYLSGSTALMSAVLVGFVLVSKLNAFGLSECGEAVVELANHSFESVVGFDKPVAFADDAVDPPTFDAFAPDKALFVPDSCDNKKFKKREKEKRNQNNWVKHLRSIVEILHCTALLGVKI